MAAITSSAVNQGMSSQTIDHIKFVCEIFGIDDLWAVNGNFTFGIRATINN